MTSTETLQKLATEAREWFETAQRGGDGDEFWRVKGNHGQGIDGDEAPEWVGELVRHAHGGDFLPDDYRYSLVVEALDAIHEAAQYEPGNVAEFLWEQASNGVSVYTSELLAWVSSNLQRVAYVDEAADEFGANDTDGAGVLVRLLSIGQANERAQTFQLVLGFLEARAAAL